MEKFTEQSLRQLAGFHGGPCVSMYVPARRMGANSAIDAARLKKLMRAVEAKVTDGVFSTDGAALLNPLNELLADRAVWNESEKGLAIFLAPGMFRTYRVPVNLPETVTVSDRFDMLPLLSLGVDDGVFFLLSLSQNHVQLFRGTQQEFKAIQLDKELASLEEFTRSLIFEKHPQMHSGAKAMRGVRSKQNAVFHGGDSVSNRKKRELNEFFRAVDHEVSQIIGTSDVPLLLAGVSYVRAIYRNASHFPHILDAEIEGNIDNLSMDELHETGWALAEPYIRRRREDDLGKFRTLAGTGLASDQMNEINRAAAEGRVEALFVASSTLPDQKENDVRKMELIGQVLSTGGRVYSVANEELPAQTDVAAVMRY